MTITHTPLPRIQVNTTASGTTIGGSCWVLRPADQTEGGTELCDDSDGADDGTASAAVDTTGEHVLFHTRVPSGYVLLEPSTVNIADDDVVLTFELQTPPPPSAPANLAQPTVTVTGAARVGARFTATPGTWTGEPTFTYQWQRCFDEIGTCLDLPGQTAPDYVAQLADGDRMLRAVVTATNPQGSTTAASAPTAPIDDAPVVGSLPAITGRTTVGSTLRATSGVWLSYYGTPTFGFDWLRCTGSICSSIGERTSTYTLTDADLDAQMRVVVTATDRGGISSATSARTGTVVTIGPRSVGRPTITGAPYIGESWIASPGSWTGDGRVRGSPATSGSDAASRAPPSREPPPAPTARPRPTAATAYGSSSLPPTRPGTPRRRPRRRRRSSCAPL